MDFEWDEAERQSNLIKHGIDVACAEVLFDGRPTLTVPSSDPREHRFLTTGTVDGRYLPVI